MIRLQHMANTYRLSRGFPWWWNVDVPTIEDLYHGFYVLIKRLIRHPLYETHTDSLQFVNVLYVFWERNPRMYKSNLVAFLLFIISFSCYVIYITENPLYLHPVVLLSIMLITIVGVILFSGFHDSTYLKYILFMGLLLYLILICSTVLNVI